MRNNERAAASLGISVFGAKLYAFAVGAAIAAFAGILLAFKDSTVVYGRFDPFQSINTVGNAVVGGLGWVLGAVFGEHLGDRWARHDLRSTGSTSASWLITIGGVLLIVIVIAEPERHRRASCCTTSAGLGEAAPALRRQAAPRAAQSTSRRAGDAARRSRSTT